MHSDPDHPSSSARGVNRFGISPTPPGVSVRKEVWNRFSARIAAKPPIFVSPPHLPIAGFPTIHQRKVNLATGWQGDYFQTVQAISKGMGLPV